MKEMDRTHKKFLHVYFAMKSIIDRLNLTIAKKANDTDNKIDSELKLIDELANSIQQRRADRRMLYEEVTLRLQELGTSLALQLVLTPAEIEDMHSFLTSVRQYFRHNQKYNHNVREHLIEFKIMLVSIREHQSMHVEMITALRNTLQSAEREFEVRWAAIAKNFSALKVSLEMDNA